MKVYIVNELNILSNETYNECHGAYADKKEAYNKALEIYNIAKEQLEDPETCDCEYCESELEVWDDDSIIKVNVDEQELIMPNDKIQ